jgi:uncharacterized membrane protein
MKKYKSKYKAAKVSGTPLNTVGVGIAVACVFLTPIGGLATAAIAGAIGSTVAGSATNLSTEIIDKLKIKSCKEKISILLKQIQDEIYDFRLIIEDEIKSTSSEKSFNFAIRRILEISDTIDEMRRDMNNKGTSDDVNFVSEENIKLAEFIKSLLTSGLALNSVVDKSGTEA